MSFFELFKSKKKSFLLIHRFLFFASIGYVHLMIKWEKKWFYHQVESLISSIHRFFNRTTSTNDTIWIRLVSEAVLVELPFPFLLIASCILMKTWIQLKHTTCHFYGQHWKEIDDEGQYFSMFITQMAISKCIHTCTLTPLTPLMIITHPVIEIVSFLKKKKTTSIRNLYAWLLSYCLLHTNTSSSSFFPFLRVYEPRFGSMCVCMCV
jgi:hypothetical protein